MVTLFLTISFQGTLPCLFCTCVLLFLCSSPQSSLLPALFSFTKYLWSLSLPPWALWQLSPSTSIAPAASQTRSHMHPAQPPSRCSTCYSPLSPQNKFTKEVSQTTQQLYDLYTNFWEFFLTGGDSPLWHPVPDTTKDISRQMSTSYRHLRLHCGPDAWENWAESPEFYHC